MAKNKFFKKIVFTGLLLSLSSCSKNEINLNQYSSNILEQEKTIQSICKTVNFVGNSENRLSNETKKAISFELTSKYINLIDSLSLEKSKLNSFAEKTNNLEKSFTDNLNETIKQKSDSLILLNSKTQPEKNIKNINLSKAEIKSIEEDSFLQVKKEIVEQLNIFLKTKNIDDIYKNNLIKSISEISNIKNKDELKSFFNAIKRVVFYQKADNIFNKIVKNDLNLIKSNISKDLIQLNNKISKSESLFYFFEEQLNKPDFEITETINHIIDLSDKSQTNINTVLSISFDSDRIINKHLDSVSGYYPFIKKVTKKVSDEILSETIINNVDQLREGNNLDLTRNSCLAYNNNLSYSSLSSEMLKRIILANSNENDLFFDSLNESTKKEILHQELVQDAKYRINSSNEINKKNETIEKNILLSSGYIQPDEEDSFIEINPYSFPIKEIKASESIYQPEKINYLKNIINECIDCSFSDLIKKNQSKSAFNSDSLFQKQLLDQLGKINTQLADFENINEKISLIKKNISDVEGTVNKVNNLINKLNDTSISKNLASINQEIKNIKTQNRLLAQENNEYKKWFQKSFSSITAANNYIKQIKDLRAEFFANIRNNGLENLVISDNIFEPVKLTITVNFDSCDYQSVQKNFNQKYNNLFKNISKYLKNKKYKTNNIEIIGFSNDRSANTARCKSILKITQNKSSEEINYILSKKRADALKKLLVGYFNTNNKDIITTRGVGQSFSNCKKLINNKVKYQSCLNNDRKVEVFLDIEDLNIKPNDPKIKWLFNPTN